MINYTLIAGLILYGLMAKLLMSESIKPLAASIVTVVGYSLLTLGIQAILFMGHDVSLFGPINLLIIVTGILQFAVAYLAFSKLSSNDTAYEFLFIWLVGGFIGIFYLVPLLVSGLLARFLM